MKIEGNNVWRFSRQVNISMIVQLILLAFLIIGSWINLQTRLDLLQQDVGMLLSCQKDIQQQMRILSDKCLSYEYRLQSLEKKQN